VGDGGGRNDVLSDVCVGNPKGSQEFRADLRVGVMGAWLYVVEGEEGRRELSKDQMSASCARSILGDAKMRAEMGKP